MNRGQLYLLRHGAVDRKPGVLTGGGTDLPLNKNGRAQALAWRPFFLASPPAAVFVSPMRRAVGTAELAVPALTEKLIIRWELKEIALGTWEGIRREEIESRYPGAWEERGGNFAGYRPEGGESFQDVLDRALVVFQEMAALARSENGPVLAVTHIGVIRVLCCHLLGMDIDNLFRIQIDHAGLSMIHEQEDRHVLEWLNVSPDVISPM